MALAVALNFRILAMAATLLALIALAEGAGAADAKLSPLGVWLGLGGDGEKGHFAFYECGDKLCARLVWSSTPERRDANNPDESRRDRLLVGRDIVRDLAPAGENFWDYGRIYDPTTGNTWNCSIRVMPGGEKLRLRGYFGLPLFGESRIWTRVR